MASSVDLSLFVESSLLSDQRLEKLREVIRAAAPRWSSCLQVVEPGRPKRPIDIAAPGALAAAVEAVATARGPVYHELKRSSGIEGRERRFGSATLEGADRSLTIVVRVDDHLFSRAGEAC